MDSLSLLWREPLWLWLVLYPWGVWGWRGFIHRPRGRDYAESSLMPWARASRLDYRERRYLWRHGAFALAWLLFALAMAGPRIADTDYSQSGAYDTEVMVVMDVSRSMTARDIAPDRLERAKLEIRNLIDRMEHARMGVVIYAARPHLLTPPTLDKSVLLNDIQILHHGLLPTEGSDLQAAATFAATQFSTGKGARVILLVTDGDMLSNTAASEAALQREVERLDSEGIVFYALGIGTIEGVALLTDSGAWLRDQDRPVISRLQQTRLQQLVKTGNGLYSRVSDTDADWRRLYDGGIKHLYMAHAVQENTDLVQWRELYAWFMVPAILLLLLSNLQPRKNEVAKNARFGLIATIIIGLGNPPEVHAKENLLWQQQAYQAYVNESYLEARRAYAKVPGYAGRMGEGSSAYHQGKYTLAIQLFTQAVLDANSDRQRADAIFNLSNSHYQMADYTSASSLYQEVLRYDKDNRSARNNLAFALKLQKQQQEERSENAAGRQGRGPQSERLQDDEDITSSKLSLDEMDDSESPLPVANTQPGGMSQSELIEQGMRYSQPAVQQATRFEDKDWQYAATSAQSIVLQINALQVDESILWKRIFEIEENFPVSVETPRPLPGIPSW
jgi:Ca-activated chloride channel family protein